MNRVKEDYTSIQISKKQAAKIANELYQIEGKIIPLPGELDFNFRIVNENDSFTLKISRPETSRNYLEFQNEILIYISKYGFDDQSPEIVNDCNSNSFGEFVDDNGKKRYVRLLTWIEGRLWSSVFPHKEELLYSLGEKAGIVTSSLLEFDHPVAIRNFDWDIGQAIWTSEYIDIFNETQQVIIDYFLQKYNNIWNRYSELRKSVVHNDVNDNNVVVSNDLINPKVLSIIDYGDAIYTQTINDLAVTLAYAIMNKPDPLRAALPIVSGYNSKFPIMDEELSILYVLVAMRLVISVTKSAISKQKEPENIYLIVSERPAWDVLIKWMNINENLAYYSFRGVCGMTPHPKAKAFESWAKERSFSLKNLFPNTSIDGVIPVDLSVESTWLGHEYEYNDNELFAFKLSRLQNENPDTLIAGGYLEPRSFYITDAYKTESNNGSVHRSIHLGVDFWLPSYTPVHALFDGEVVVAVNREGDKEYGGLVILKHSTDDFEFFTLYGHQSVDSVQKHQKGDIIQKGQWISNLGTSYENGNWTSHLHFQIILDMMGNTEDYPGVTYPHTSDIWKSICPDPNFIFKETGLANKNRVPDYDILTYRKSHLGRGLSLSYNEPLNIVRGAGVYLMDNLGRKFLDTVNNVAHVGHEHKRVVEAGQRQMSVLNTNTRYLHENIVDFMRELLSTFPDELSVVHFVNSGSEANELALRMARAYSGEMDMIAVEVGYHGNTTGCVDVSSYKFDGKGGKGAPEHTYIVPLPDSYRGIYQGKDAGKKYASHIQTQIDYIHSKGRGVGGFICESIISCGGQIELPTDYLKIAYKSVKDAGGLCISDEIQVGCGRVGIKYWGFQLHNVIPDIVTIGKPIGNGHPLAAVVCTQEVADRFANGMEYFNTFGGNPVSCAIGLEVLSVIEDEKLQENALTTGNYLKTELHKLQQDFTLIGDVRGQGLFIGFELVDNDKLPLTQHAAYLVNRMKDYGILMSTDGKDNNVLKIKPPMVFSKDNADELMLRLKLVLGEDFMISY